MAVGVGDTCYHVSYNVPCILGTGSVEHCIAAEFRSVQIEPNP